MLLCLCVVRVVRSGEQTESIGIQCLHCITEEMDSRGHHRSLNQSEVLSESWTAFFKTFCGPLLDLFFLCVCSCVNLNVTANRMSGRLWGPVRSEQLFRCRCSSPLTFADTWRRDAAIWKLKSPRQEHDRLTLSSVTLIFLYGWPEMDRRINMKVIEKPVFIIWKPPYAPNFLSTPAKCVLTSTTRFKTEQRITAGLWC